MESIKLKLPGCLGLTNCCFFIPLKQGLLALTYICLVFHIALLAAAFIFVSYLAIISGLGGGLGGTDFLLFVPLPWLVVAVTHDLIVIVAVHTENVKGLKNSLIFGAVLLVVTTPFCVYLSYYIINYAVDPFCYQLVLIILEPLARVYGLLLIRSLKMKLRGDGKTEYITLE